MRKYGSKKGRHDVNMTAKAKPAANLIIDDVAPQAALTHDVASQAKDRFESIVKVSQEQAQKHFEQTVATTKEQVEKASSRWMKSYEEYAAFRKASMEALLKSSTIATKGAEDISKEMISFAQASFDKSLAASRALLSVNSINEMVDLQKTYAQQSVDALVAQASRMQELSMGVVTEALAPLNTRMSATVEMFTKPHTA